MRTCIAILLFICFSCHKTAKNKLEEVQIIVDSTGLKIKALEDQNKNPINEGQWISLMDSLSTIKIEGNQWVFQYGNEKTEAEDCYIYVITESVFDDRNSIVEGNLLLTNQLDTLEYGINFLSEKNMSLTYLPRGNTLFYYKKSNLK